MSSLKQYKQAEKLAAQHRQVIAELEAIVKDIERCERTISDLNAELQRVNQKHAERKTTREDIAYLEDLLKCANKKLTWEKHMASIQKRTPDVLQRISNFMQDPDNPPDHEMRAAMLGALKTVQAAMQRLEGVK